MQKYIKWKKHNESVYIENSIIKYKDICKKIH